MARKDRNLNKNLTTANRKETEMNLSAIASIGLVIALAAIPQLVIYYVNRAIDKYVEPEYDYDIR